MPRWAWLVVAVCAPGGLVLAAAVWLRRRWLRHADAQTARLITPPIYRFTRADESLFRNAAVRRALAQEKRVEAAQIDSGHRHDDRRIQLVGRR